MMARIFKHLRNLDWMDYTGLVVIVATGIFAFNFSDSAYSMRRWLIIPILATFMLFHLLPHTKERSTHAKHLQIALMAFMATTMFWVTNETFGGVLLFFILSATVALSFSVQTAYRWIAVFGIVTIIGNMLAWSVFWPALIIGATSWGGYSFFGAAASAQRRAEQASAESKRLLAELQSAYRQLEEQSSQAEDLAAAQERNRLAREVHDTLGHRLTVAAVQLEGAQRLVYQNPAKAAEMVETVRTQVLEGLNELRRTVSALRAPLVDDLSLPNALNRLVANFQEATGIDTTLHIEDALPQMLSTAQRQALYRVAQESLTNVQRHAKARHAWVELTQCNGALQLSIDDDGVGFEPNQGNVGFGLHGLHERAAQIGGAVEIGARPGGGARVLLRIPLDGEEEG